MPKYTYMLKNEHKEFSFEEVKIFNNKTEKQDLEYVLQLLKI